MCMTNAYVGYKFFMPLQVNSDGTCVTVNYLK